MLTIERIRGGIKINDVHALDAAGIDRRVLADNAARAVAKKMIFEDGFFHADPPHPGNLFVEPDGRIGLIDFGMAGEIDERLREQLAALLVALAGQNPRRVASAVAELSSTKGTINVSALTADLAPILQRYTGRALGEHPGRSVDPRCTRSGPPAPPETAARTGVAVEDACHGRRPRGGRARSGISAGRDHRSLRPSPCRRPVFAGRIGPSIQASRRRRARRYRGTP